MKKIRILLADDHAIVRTGLASLLGRKADLAVVGEAADGEEAVAQTLRLKPDVVVMDLLMPKKNGAEATAVIHTQRPETKILILTSFGDANDLAVALANGATSAALKNIPNDELVEAIRETATGARFLPPDIRQMLSEDEPTPNLSPRQRQILESIGRGLSNTQIGLQLGISAESVKTHVALLFRKIGVASRSEAIARAFRKHLLRDEQRENGQSPHSE